MKWAAVVGVGLGAAAGAGVLFALGPIGPIAAGVVAVSIPFPIQVPYLIFVLDFWTCRCRRRVLLPGPGTDGTQK